MIENQNLKCEIVKDILPLYVDEVVSDVTKNEIKLHLENCDNCQQEYNSLLFNFSKISDSKKTDTKNKFLNMMKKLKYKRIAINSVIILLICGILCGGFFILTNIPIKKIDDNEIEVIRVYRYKSNSDDNSNYKFFVLFRTPNYENSSYMTIDVSSSNDYLKAELNKKIPIISHKIKDENIKFSDDIWIFDDFNDKTIDGNNTNFKSLEFGGQEIWNESKNKNDKVPDYVYAHEEFSNSNGTQWCTDITDKNNGIVTFFDNESNALTWDLDGNLIYSQPKPNLNSENSN